MNSIKMTYMDPNTTQPAPAQGTQKKILLVEDEALIRELYSRQLTRAGFAVKPVETGELGVEAIKTEDFDLILLDIMLPGINGLEVLKQFKTLKPGAAQTVVIMLTNLGQDSVIKEGFDLGAQAYLIKTSYTPDQVVQEVNNALAGKASNPNPYAPQPPAQ